MEIPVVVEKVCFRKDNGFAILSCSLNEHSDKYQEEHNELIEPLIHKTYGTFTVTVGMLDANEDPTGTSYIVMGDIVSHKKFGKQIKANFYHQDIPADAESLQAFLMTLPNIKKQRSKEIIKLFGVEGTLKVLDRDPDQLTQIAGITSQRIPAIKQAWDQKKAMRDLYNWLVKYKIELGLAEPIYKTWGCNAITKIEENPYTLIELRGVGFIKADAIAHRMPKKISKEDRVKACIHYILQEVLYKQGDLCIPYGTLKKHLIKVLGDCDHNLDKNFLAETYLKLIPSVIKTNLETFAVVKNKETSQVFVYLNKVWMKEVFIAKTLCDRIKQPRYKSGFEDKMDHYIDMAENDLTKWYDREINLDESQKEAIKSAFLSRVSIITGGGGSGKSTICRCIFYLAQELGMSVRMMSPTGKAAQVLTEKTGCGASTIHRGLKMVPNEELPGENISEHLLLIDEISMSGLDTMYAIMAAIEDNTKAHIVFVGDRNQLPSVSPGNFLSDIMNSGLANTIVLDTIHRQDEGSYISLLANEISKGRVVEIPEEADDIKWHRIHAEDFSSQILGYIDDYLAEGNDLSSLQIISPMKKGNCGVFQINDAMQKKMALVNNTVDLMFERGFTKYYVGDRVIQTENNYEKEVFNGDMGVISDIGEEVVNPAESDEKKHYVEVDYYGDFTKYYDEEIDQIMLAWAITVHKFQGSQAKDVVFIMANEQQIMMSKELVYTAFTRAEKMLNIFGSEQMLRIAPTKSVIRKRHTNMNDIIKEIQTGTKTFEVLGYE
tara:strand:+ start:8655 stop:10982 length:2328 start_codon:yes stop_codon:yes gene_type:complete